jgi:hypothetical protein
LLPELLLVIGAALGYAAGRWKVLLAAVPFGIWVASVEEVEVPGVVLGVGYGGLAAASIALGVWFRKARRAPPAGGAR